MASVIFFFSHHSERGELGTCIVFDIELLELFVFVWQLEPLYFVIGNGSK